MRQALFYTLPTISILMTVVYMLVSTLRMSFTPKIESPNILIGSIASKYYRLSHCLNSAALFFPIMISTSEFGATTILS